MPGMGHGLEVSCHSPGNVGVTVSVCILDANLGSAVEGSVEMQR